MNAPLISVVLPTYNGEKFLTQQLDSIFSQTYSNIELIISDDASTDNTPDIISQFKDRPGVKFIRNDNNAGFVRNFQNALDHASGEFIAPCDQDDVWLPNKLQTLIDASSDQMMVYSNSELVDENNQPLGCSLVDTLKINFVSGNNHRAFYYGNCVAAHTMLFRRELLDYFDIFPETVFHDHWLAFIASRVGSIRGLKNKLVLYRRHSSNVTRKIKKKRFTGNLVSYLRDKADRQSMRNLEKIKKLKDFQAFQNKVDMPDTELDTLIGELEKFDEYFFNRKIYSILNSKRNEYFAISKKSTTGLILEESLGRKYYNYIPMTI